MGEELLTLEVNHTWDLVPHPSSSSYIESKSVCSVKVKSDTTLDRYNAELVPQGFKQEHGIDYEETFAPVAKMTTKRSQVSIVATCHCPLWQMDVKDKFLHGDLHETMYKRPPLGLSCPSKWCRLKKSLYGLKPAP